MMTDNPKSLKILTDRLAEVQRSVRDVESAVDSQTDTFAEGLQSIVDTLKGELGTIDRSVKKANDLEEAAVANATVEETQPPSKQRSNKQASKRKPREEEEDDEDEKLPDSYTGILKSYFVEPFTAIDKFFDVEKSSGILGDFLKLYVKKRDAKKGTDETAPLDVEEVAAPKPQPFAKTRPVDSDVIDVDFREIDDTTSATRNTKPNPPVGVGRALDISEDIAEAKQREIAASRVSPLLALPQAILPQTRFDASSSLNAEKVDTLSTTEDEREAAALQEKQIDLLSQIAENTKDLLKQSEENTRTLAKALKEIKDQVEESGDGDGGTSIWGIPGGFGGGGGKTKDKPRNPKAEERARRMSRAKWYNRGKSFGAAVGAAATGAATWGGKVIEGVKSWGSKVLGSASPAAKAATEAAPVAVKTATEAAKVAPGVAKTATEVVPAAAKAATEAAPVAVKTATEAAKVAPAAAAPAATEAAKRTISSTAKSVGGKALGALGTGVVLYGAYDEYGNIEQAKSTGQITAAQAREKHGENIGGTGGGLAGAAAGAVAGQILIPVPVLGAIIGSVAGGLAGDWLGSKVGGAAAKMTGPSDGPEQQKKADQLKLADKEKKLAETEAELARFKSKNYDMRLKANRDYIERLEKDTKAISNDIYALKNDKGYQEGQMSLAKPLATSPVGSSAGAGAPLQWQMSAPSPVNLSARKDTGGAAAPVSGVPQPQRAIDASSSRGAPAGAMGGQRTGAPAASLKPAKMISGDDDVKAMIKAHEGKRNVPYKDSLGLWTVGYGHLIGDGKSLPPSWNRQFSDAEIDKLFEEDYAAHKQAAQQIPGFNKMNATGRGALTDLTFNMGGQWYKKWPNFTKNMSEGNTEGAARSLEQSKWYGQVGNRAPTIVSMVRAGGGAGRGSADDPRRLDAPSNTDAKSAAAPTEGTMQAAPVTSKGLAPEGGSPAGLGSKAAAPANPLGTGDTGKASSASLKGAVPDKKEVDARVQEKLKSYPENMRSDVSLQKDLREEATMEMKASSVAATQATPKRTPVIAGEPWTPGTPFTKKQLDYLKKGRAEGKTFSYEATMQYDLQTTGKTAPVSGAASTDAMAGVTTGDKVTPKPITPNSESTAGAGRGSANDPRRTDTAIKVPSALGTGLFNSTPDVTRSVMEGQGLSTGQPTTAKTTPIMTPGMGVVAGDVPSGISPITPATVSAAEAIGNLMGPSGSILGTAPTGLTPPPSVTRAQQIRNYRETTFKPVPRERIKYTPSGDQRTVETGTHLSRTFDEEAARNASIESRLYTKPISENQPRDIIPTRPQIDINENIALTSPIPDVKAPVLSTDTAQAIPIDEVSLQIGSEDTPLQNVSSTIDAAANFNTAAALTPPPTESFVAGQSTPGMDVGGMIRTAGSIVSSSRGGRGSNDIGRTISTIGSAMGRSQGRPEPGQPNIAGITRTAGTVLSAINSNRGGRADIGRTISTVGSAIGSSMGRPQPGQPDIAGMSRTIGSVVSASQRGGRGGRGGPDIGGILSTMGSAMGRGPREPGQPDIGGIMRTTGGIISSQSRGGRSGRADPLRNIDQYIKLGEQVAGIGRGDTRTPRESGQAPRSSTPASRVGGGRSPVASITPIPVSTPSIVPGDTSATPAESIGTPVPSSDITPAASLSSPPAMTPPAATKGDMLNQSQVEISDMKDKMMAPTKGDTTVNNTTVMQGGGGGAEKSPFLTVRNDDNTLKDYIRSRMVYT